MLIELIGLALIIATIGFTLYWVTSNRPHKAWVVSVCVIAIFSGCFLFLYRRVFEVTVKGVGTIKAAVEQVSLDAAEVSKLRVRVEAQSSTVDLVASSAEEAKKLSKEMSEKVRVAESRLSVIDATVTEAHKTLAKLDQLVDFSCTLLAAQNDGRRAFDRLLMLSKDTSFPYHEEANRAYVAIYAKHAGTLFLNWSNPWSPEGVNLSTLELQGLKKIYTTYPIQFKPALIEYIRKRSDIQRKDRLQFLIDVISNDEGLTAVSYAGWNLNNEVGLGWNTMAIDSFTSWWREHSLDFK